MTAAGGAWISTASDREVKAFEDIYGVAPAVVAQAPGRVNLLGEHTDYNDGYVLPTTIPQVTTVSLAPAPDRYVVYSAELDRCVTFTPEQPPGEPFAAYVYCCVRVALDQGASIPPLAMHIASTVPTGVGLSSRAALEVATFRALRELLSERWDDVSIARYAQQAGTRYAGEQCGIMDQMAASLGAQGYMLFLDIRTLQRRMLPQPAGSDILVIDSGIPPSLAATAYNARRAECAEAARLLGVPALRDVTYPHAAEHLPDPLGRRARHVIGENARVLEACGGVSAADFGALMNASHGSLRDDYEVSVRAVDQLIELLQGDSAVHGARMTGAGFGGACVALCHAGMAATVGSRIVGAYNRTGAVARVLVPEPEPGAASAGH